MKRLRIGYEPIALVSSKQRLLRYNRLQIIQSVLTDYVFFKHLPPLSSFFVACIPSFLPSLLHKKTPKEVLCFFRSHSNTKFSIWTARTLNGHFDTLNSYFSIFFSFPSKNFASSCFSSSNRNLPHRLINSSIVFFSTQLL